MAVLERIHETWYPVMGKLNEMPLMRLKDDILPNISFQPKSDNIFRVFEKPLYDVRVVVLGQDPYPSVGDANGLAFAVNEDRKMPASMRIIHEELLKEHVSMNKDTFFRSEWKTLQHWADQGVFLLNTALTVETGKAGSHINYWMDFTRDVIAYISSKRSVIWLLWGKKAQSFIPFIQGKVLTVGRKYTDELLPNIPSGDYNYVIPVAHPAAEVYSKDAGFLNSRCFLIVNQILTNNRSNEINW